MSSDVFLNSDIKKSLLKICHLLSELNKPSNEQILSIAHERNLIIKTKLQALFGFKFDNKLDSAIYEMILSHSFKAEQQGPGSFDLCLELIVRMILDDYKISNQLLNDVVSKGATLPTETDIDWLFSTYCSNSDQKLISSLRHALNMSGFGGTVMLEKSFNDIQSIELKNGYTFKVKPSFALNAKFRDVKIVTMDAYVEGVHELSVFLEDAAQTKTPALLFARGFSDDVVHTLKVNYDRGSLKVIPIIVEFSLPGMNTLADISVVSFSDLISTTKGDLVSTAKFSLSPTIQCADVFSDHVVLYSTASNNQVMTHVKHLRDRRELENSDDIASLLDDRIRSLSPKHVVFRISNDKNFVKNSQTVDYVLRAYRSLLLHGTIVHENKKYLNSTFIAANLYANKCVKNFYDLGAAIV